MQQAYIARLKAENHLYHDAYSNDRLKLIIYNLKPELEELRQKWEEWLKTDAEFKTNTTAQLAQLTEATRITTEKIRAHLQETVEATHRRELVEADQATTWQDRQRLREAAEAAHTVRLGKIDELAASFADIEGRGAATSVFQEMTRIITEQGVDEAIAYVAGQRANILQTVRARAAATRERNRADLQPLLKAAALHESKGQPSEARALYNDILSAEPDWPDALHAYFWFLTDQGDAALVHTTLADALREYDEARRLAHRLTAGDPGNTGWQRDLSVSYEQARRRGGGAGQAG